jgi:hypothetical protein
MDDVAMLRDKIRAKIRRKFKVDSARRLMNQIDEYVLKSQR